MAGSTRGASDYMRGLGSLFESGGSVGLTDRELLERFAQGAGASAEAAFATLVLRHGPMVLGVCRRVLADPHDVDDAFQASFLVLVRKAGSIRVDDSLGGWLHGVSLKVANRARSQALKRPHQAGASAESWEAPSSLPDELGPILDAEISRLPGPYREALRLCYLEGLALKDAAAELGCPIGTVGSRLARAKDLLRSRLVRRGLSRSALLLPAYLAPSRLRAAAVSEALFEAATRCATKGAAGTVPATVVALASFALRNVPMSKGLFMAAAVLVGLGCFGTGTVVFGRRDEPKQEAPPAVKAEPASKPKAVEPSVADRFKQIRAEFEAEQRKVAEAAEAAKTEFERWKIYGDKAPDDAAYSRRMVDLALTAPKDPASRDALVWVLDKTYRTDEGPYGIQFARAAEALVNQHADDPEAVRVALQLDNLVSRHRDALMEGLYAGAKGCEAKGLARLALAQYLEVKALFAKDARDSKETRSIQFQTYDDSGKLVDKSVALSNEAMGYRVGLRLLDPEAVLVEAERLYREVISDYGDLPHITTRLRELEALLKEPVPKWDDKPLTAEEIEQARAMTTRQKTLAQVAEGHLDEMHHIKVGQPAPEIEGTDLDGKPLKLSDFRGKVVALVFWGSWCGPCMREVPHERELVERYKGKPFALLGVNCREKAEAAKKTVESEKMAWPHWHDGDVDGGPIVEKFHVRQYPTIFVIDAKGIIRHKDAIGESLDKAVESLMRQM